MPALHRRNLLAGAVALAGCASASDGRIPSRLSEDLARYVGFGDKGTGGASDAGVASWLESRLGEAGFAVSRQSVMVRGRGEVRSAIVCGLAYEAAIQAGSPGPASGARGALAKSAEVRAGDVALVDAPVPLDAYWPERFNVELETVARRGAVGAIVRPAPGQADAMLAYNRNADLPDLPLPTLIVAPSVHAELGARLGEVAALQLPGPIETLTSDTVFAFSRGFASARRKVVISTPRTGWFACGAERGGGVVLLLALAERFGRDPNVGLALAATTGHELGHKGMKAFLGAHAPVATETDLWLHLGSCIAAQRASYVPSFPAQQAVLSAPALSQARSAAFGALGYSGFALTEASSGEGGDVARAGYGDVVALAGLHPTFHTPLDDGAAIEPQILARMLDLLALFVMGEI